MVLMKLKVKVLRRQRLGLRAKIVAVYSDDDEIQEYHRKHPIARVVDANDDFEALLKEEPQIEYVNSKFGEPIEYSAYLDICSETDKLPIQTSLI
ncbi:splicing factor SF3a60 protein [Trifolium repens]|nr:splicing factor SF3a60 protein [Trifolium repens]